jgi:uncharacterized protein YecT (DUF1311 family)
MKPHSSSLPETTPLRWLSNVCLAALLCLAAFPVMAQDEKPAPTLKEAKAEFEKQDKALNAAWDEVKKSKELSDAEQAELKDEQKAWVAYRDEMSLSPGYSGAPENEAEARKSAEYFSCAASITEERTAWLKGRIAKAPAENVTGVWSDSYGGELRIVQKDKKLYFSIDVVRGPTAHLGSISGIASWNEPLGWFSDKEGQKDKTDEANVSFVLKRNHFQITTANASS